MTAVQAHGPTGSAVARTGFDRLLGVDAVRGIALLGVFVMHFQVTGWWHAGPPDATPEALVWVQQHTSSRAMSLFVLLAGLSVALMTGGPRPYTGMRMARARLRVLVRAAVLLLIGLCVAQFAIPSVLEYYAVLLILLVPFTALRVRTLAVLATAAVPAVTLYAVWMFNRHADFMRMSPPQGLEILVRPDRWGDYLDALVLFGGGFQTIYGIPLVLAGLAIGRSDLRNQITQRRMAVAGSALAGGAWLLSRLADRMFAADTAALDTPPSARDLLRMPGPSSLYATSAVGIVLMIGLALLLVAVLSAALDHVRMRRLAWPLVATGSMTLTWYVGHLFFLRLIGPDALFSFAGFVGLVALVLAVSALVRLWCRRGPLEWLVHRAITAVVRP
ncbi:heparan-alpha-glucosaminide N-acetyltransferase domain-containing protein [Nocardia transvalensis]|uniref:heparan-alpha-glucosaminide N-acetyltransferase domain-containing protein n=1 Tax=Nocardia transvalensis TaxID=37333 RepID=UPI001892FA91|nr:heparan-alpha-glucosaminide N-acetyltransferase domain-containing protein [Nocardia transvalensis]MBF6330788.1 hypothetical protein [Nocardia transvalensis]